jgi:hypothetical protein
VPPTVIEGLGGVSRSDTKLGEITVKVVEPLTDPEVARILVVPADKAVASPTALMEAIDGAEELHTEVAVRSAVVPSL